MLISLFENAIIPSINGIKKNMFIVNPPLHYQISWVIEYPKISYFLTLPIMLAFPKHKFVESELLVIYD